MRINITFYRIGDFLVKRQGNCRSKVISDKFTVSTKPMICPLESEWFEKKIKVDKAQIKKHPMHFIGNKHQVS